MISDELILSAHESPLVVARRRSISSYDGSKNFVLRIAKIKSQITRKGIIEPKNSRLIS